MNGYFASTPGYGHSVLGDLLRERFILKGVSAGCTWAPPIQICEVCGCLHRSWLGTVCYSCDAAIEKVRYERMIEAFEKVARCVSLDVSATVNSLSEHTAQLLSEKAIVPVIVPNNYDEFVRDTMHRIASTFEIPVHRILRPIPEPTPYPLHTARPKPRGPEKRGKWWDHRSQRY